MAKDPVPKKKTRAVVRRRYTQRNHPEWMETHVWHAKRMFMTNWGLRIALKSHQKGYKSTFRGLRDGCFFRDVSYQQILMIQGDATLLDSTFMTLCDPTEPRMGAPRFKNKYGSIWFHEYLEFPKKAICRIGFLWNPARNGIWVWIPCYAYDEVYRQIFLAACRTQGVACPQKEEIPVIQAIAGSISFSVLQKEYSRFEFRGRASHTVLQHVLCAEDSFGGLDWKQLRDIVDAKQVSPGTVISLEIQDPRIKYEMLTPGSPCMSPKNKIRIRTKNKQSG
jgi:ribonuclease P/MRP protein subunit POP1